MNNTLVYLAVNLIALNFEEKLCHISNDVLSSCSLPSLVKCSRICDSDAFYSRGGRDSAYERGKDARRKFWIKPLKETDLRVAQNTLSETKIRNLYP